MGTHDWRRFTVYGPSRLRWLRPLSRRPVPEYTYLGFGAGTSAAAGLLFTHHAWIALVVFGLPSIAGAVVLVAVLTRQAVVLYERDLTKTWLSVAKAYAAMGRSLPELRGMIDVRQARAVIERARIDLALLMVDRQRIHAALYDAKQAEYGLAADDPLRAELADRRDLLGERLARLDAEVARRTDRFIALARQWAEFAYHRAVAERQARAARRAIGTLEGLDLTLHEVSRWETRVDPATDLAERTEAVLAAYQELEAEVGKAGPGPDLDGVRRRGE